jgi:hypothetical protein
MTILIPILAIAASGVTGHCFCIGLAGTLAWWREDHGDMFALLAAVHLGFGGVLLMLHAILLTLLYTPGASA